MFTHTINKIGKWNEFSLRQRKTNRSEKREAMHAIGMHGFEYEQWNLLELGNEDEKQLRVQLTTEIVFDLGRRYNPVSHATATSDFANFFAIGPAIIITWNAVGSGVSHRSCSLGADAGDELQRQMDNRIQDAAQDEDAIIFRRSLLRMPNRRERQKTDC